MLSIWMGGVKLSVTCGTPTHCRSNGILFTHNQGFNVGHAPLGITRLVAQNWLVSFVVAMEYVVAVDGRQYGISTMPRRWVDSLHDDGI